MNEKTTFDVVHYVCASNQFANQFLLDLFMLIHDFSPNESNLLLSDHCYILKLRDLYLIRFEVGDEGFAFYRLGSSSNFAYLPNELMDTVNDLQIGHSVAGGPDDAFDLLCQAFTSSVIDYYNYLVRS